MRAERGNILFLILLAVVLFAALSYAVTNATRGGGKDGGTEKSKAYAAEIMQYGAMMANAINRLRLSNGCRDNEISFQNSHIAIYPNSQTPADGRCKVFDPAGGGVSWKNVSPEWLDPYFSGPPWSSVAATAYLYGKPYFPSNVSFKGVGTFNSSTALATAVDLSLIFGFLNDDVCRAINTELGLPFPLYGASPTSTAIVNMVDGAPFQGYYSSCYPSDCNYAARLLDSNNNEVSASQFCVTGSWGYNDPEPTKNLNMYVHTLITR